MKTIRELREQIAVLTIKADEPPLSDDRCLICDLAAIVKETLAILEETKATANRAASEASCLANGIQPD